MGGGNSKPACYGIGCCDKSYHWDPKTQGAKWCADEGGRCSADGGKAEIYYGWGLTWQRKTLAKGRSIKCGNGDMGCDPLPGTRKYCFKVQDVDPTPAPTPPPQPKPTPPPTNAPKPTPPPTMSRTPAPIFSPVCCEGEWSVTKTVLFKTMTVDGEEPAQQFANHDAAMAYVIATAEDTARDLADKNGVPQQLVLANLDIEGKGGIAEDVYKQICETRECFTNTPHPESGPERTTESAMVWAPENNLEMPSLYQMDLYLVPIIAFFLLFLSCVQCWSLVKRCKRRVPKKYRAVKRIDYESEVGTDEAMPMK